MNKSFVGLDFGRGYIKAAIEIDGIIKVAKIPARYTTSKPPGQISEKTGIELKSKSFMLLIKGQERWFGDDVLSVQSFHENDISKCSPEHISILFRAALYKWSKQHNIDLNSLGKLHIVASMPPGDFKKSTLNKAILNIYRKTFNTGQSHPKIRDGKNTWQIVTHFDKLVPEAAVWGSSMPRKNELILVVDIGYFTVDYVWFNGSVIPAQTLSDNAGLLHAYSAMNSINPAQAELKVLRLWRKGLLPDKEKDILMMAYNKIKGRIQETNSQCEILVNKAPDKIYFIGGGASLADSEVKQAFSGLATKVIYKNEFTNVEANRKKASAHD
jgi:hypothetical protein